VEGSPALLAEGAKEEEMKYCLLSASWTKENYLAVAVRPENVMPK
jgi:hypothetical protein